MDQEFFTQEIAVIAIFGKEEPRLGEAACGSTVTVQLGCLRLATSRTRREGGYLSTYVDASTDVSWGCAAEEPAAVARPFRATYGKVALRGGDTWTIRPSFI
jgi:hypothetical protein